VDSARRYEDGTVILRDAAGFALALHPCAEGTAIPVPPFLNFGFETAAAEEVRALLARLEQAGVEIVERYDTAGHVSFKCLDPDGHRVEVYWEPT
jgi:catechol 2,3-dioxygenase-like lactoylglutathione lyase family enzyme